MTTVAVIQIKREFKKKKVRRRRKKKVNKCMMRSMMQF